MSIAYIFRDIEHAAKAAATEVECGGDPKVQLRLFSMIVDHAMAEAVKSFGGDPWHFKRANETSLQLALDEVD